LDVKNLQRRTFSQFSGLNSCPFLTALVVCNAIELLRSWEPQESDNWAMQREASVMTNLIAGFGHQKCFVDEILTPGSQLHCYVKLLLPCAWRGPAAHDWSGLMQLLLSALLSGLEISETIYRSPISVNVAVIEPVCNNFVAILADDVYRFRSFKPLRMLTKGQQTKQLKQIIDHYATAPEAMRILLDPENHAVRFFDESATREIQACFRARHLFPNLDLYPLWRLAAFHRHQILSIGAVVIKSLHDCIALYDKLLTTAASSQLAQLSDCLPPLVASALLLIDLPFSLTPTIISCIPFLLDRLNLP
jgi:hypothetical protein